jgi:shikimate kinase
VGAGHNRGLAIAPGMSMSDLYRERQPLYRAAADITVRTDDRTPEECVQAILNKVNFT